MVISMKKFQSNSVLGGTHIKQRKRKENTLFDAQKYQKAYRKFPTEKVLQMQYSVAESKRMTYTGQNYGIHSANISSACKYHVGILNKRTGKMKICDTEIFHMRPNLEADEPENIFEEKQNDLSLAERANLLTSDFGSSKKRKAMESRLKFHVGGDELESAMKTATNEIFQHGTTLDQMNASVAASEDNTMPPCNKEATSPEDVYQLHDIITNIEMEEITNEARKFYDSNREKVAEWTEEGTFHKYVLSHLQHLPIQEDSRWLKCKKLIYLNYMLTLAGLKPNFMKKKDPLPSDWPSAVREKLLAMFTLKAGEGKKVVRCVPARLKDKLVAYILVLTLNIDDNTVELEDLMVDLKLGLRTLNQRFKLLGCQVKSQKNPDDSKTNMAVLKIPLTFPKEKITKVKKRN